MKYDGAFVGSLAYNLSNPKLGEEEKKEMVERHAHKQSMAQQKRLKGLSHQKRQEEASTDPSEWALASLSKRALSPLAPAESRIGNDPPIPYFHISTNTLVTFARKSVVTFSLSTASK